MLGVPASRAMKCDSSSGSRPAGEDSQKGGFDGLAVVGSEIGDSTRGGEEVALDLVAHDIAVHEHEALGDRAAARVEFVFAGVAVAADEIVAAGISDQYG